jgi:hypothetical protein
MSVADELWTHLNKQNNKALKIKPRHHQRILSNPCHLDTKNAASYPQHMSRASQGDYRCNCQYINLLQKPEVPTRGLRTTMSEAQRATNFLSRLHLASTSKIKRAKNVNGNVQNDSSSTTQHTELPCIHQLSYNFSYTLLNLIALIHFLWVWVKLMSKRELTDYREPYLIISYIAWLTTDCYLKVIAGNKQCLDKNAHESMVELK